MHFLEDSYAQPLCGGSLFGMSGTTTRSAVSCPECVAVDNAMRRLRSAAERLAALQAEVADLVNEARADGEPWSRIGDALGVSKQAAQQRYGRST